MKGRLIAAVVFVILVSSCDKSIRSETAVIDRLRVPLHRLSVAAEKDAGPETLGAVSEVLTIYVCGLGLSDDLCSD